MKTYNFKDAMVIIRDYKEVKENSDCWYDCVIIPTDKNRMITESIFQHDFDSLMDILEDNYGILDWSII